MILPATLSTVNTLFQGSERAIAFAIWGSTIGGMAAVGPFLGGLLTTELSWRWAFLINIPLGVAILLGLLTLVPETSDPQAPRGFDLPGQFTLIVGLGALVFGLIEGQTYGWWTSTRRLTCSPGRRERSRRSQSRSCWPLVSLTRIPAHRAGTASGRAARRRRPAAVLDFQLQPRQHRRADRRSRRVRTTVRTAALPPGRTGAQRTGDRGRADSAGRGHAHRRRCHAHARASTRSARRRAARPPARGARHRDPRPGAHLNPVGLADHPVAFIYGVGVGFATAQLTGVILTDVPVQASGQGSGIQSTFRQVGSALGIAILGTILVTTLGSQASARLRTVPGLPPASRRPFRAPCGRAEAARSSACAPNLAANRSSPPPRTRSAPPPIRSRSQRPASF